ncbi:hypothetical protein COL940_008821 [Colletotrichum noveboracense]|nr:hypothetical protein COL940_008821 [Colletotrichum noveboracense]
MAQDVAQPSTGGPQDSRTAALANMKAKLGPRNPNSSGAGRTQSAAAEALRSLLDEHSKTGVDKSLRAKRLRALGKKPDLVNTRNKEERDVDTMHQSLAIMFNNDDEVHASLAVNVGDKSHTEECIIRVVGEFILEKTSKLQHLLARGLYKSTILHIILDPTTYSRGSTTDTQRRLDFGRLKFLVKFLLWLQPELPTVMRQDGTTPLFSVVKSGLVKTNEEDPESLDESSETGSNPEEQEDSFLDETTKTEIIRFICNQNPDGEGGPTDPIRSLALLASHSEDQVSKAQHAVHAAIESDFNLPDDIIARLKNIRVNFKVAESSREEEKICLEVPDRVGRTCLHLALTAPFTTNRIAWAKQLAKVQPSLFKLQYRQIRTGESNAKGRPIVDYMTPLQYLVEQRKPTGMNGHKGKIKVDLPKAVSLLDKRLDKELDDLEDFLKCQCLESFSYITCKAIMYTRQNEREIFLTLSEEMISSEFLENQRMHYKLDTLLQSVYIANNNEVRWNDEKAWDEKTHEMVTEWGCLGDTNLFMVFHWLKDQIRVKKVFEVVVDELLTSKLGHSDMAIVKCLQNLDVETWDWRRMDIPANVIIDTAGDHVKSLYLYCSGLKAVLQSWSDTRGLVNLKRGLESKDCVRKFAKDFKDDMERIHEERYKVDIEKGLKSKLEVVCKPVYAPKINSPTNDAASNNVKEEGELGFEESVEPVTSNTPKVRPIKVALIDDGVKTSYDGLDEIVHCGRFGWGSVSGSASTTSKRGDKRKAANNYPLNYNHSQTGHGTVMAYFIRRVCPWVKLCIAKLECQARSGRNQPVTFSIESATEAIKWAVNEKVDIISMSWAIDQSDSIQKTQEAQETQLREAITMAEDHGILLFCANPDKNKPGNLPYKSNKTYPKSLVSEQTLFCIGAATPDGKPWERIHQSDQSCDFILPGVKLRVDIPELVTTSKRQGAGKPPKEWHDHSGSSLSCALAAGLAAMVLHCTLVNGLLPDGPEWTWLRSRDGMRKALQNISEEPADERGLWLHVRSVFGEAAKTIDSHQKMMRDALRNNVVEKLLRGSPRLSGDGPGDSEPAPRLLKKRATIKDEKW